MLAKGIFHVGQPQVAGQSGCYYDTINDAASIAGGPKIFHLETAVMRLNIAYLAFAGVFALTFAASPIRAAEGEFSSTTIDLGVVTTDVEKSVKFYTEAIGFKELKGFSVGAEYAKEVGLT